MSIESPNLIEGLYPNERFELAKDQIRNELMMRSCPNIDDAECIQKWADTYAVPYNKLFNKIASSFDDMMRSLDMDPDTVINTFKERLDREIEDDIDLAA